jgi:hypothetical protein
MSECDQQRADIDRCQREIAAIEAQILAGHPDLRGLCLALCDWSGELRLLQGAGEATETARLAPVCDDLPEVGPVTPMDAGGRDVGAAWRDPGLGGASRVPNPPHGAGVGSRQMIAGDCR